MKHLKTFEELTDLQKDSTYNKKKEEIISKQEKLQKKIEYSKDIIDPDKTEETRKKKKEEIEKNKKN